MIVSIRRNFFMRAPRLANLLLGGVCTLSALFCSAARSEDDRSLCEGDLECLFCSALTDPEQYQNSLLKLTTQVAPGKDRWLFRSTVDFSSEFGIPAPMQPEFARLMNTFKAHGTQVAIAVQPTRGLMHRDKIRPDRAYGFDYAKSSASLRAFLAQLRAGGAIVPDVMQLVEHPPEQEYFFRRDHHWAPAGAKVTAQLVADEIRRQPFYEDLTKKYFRTEPGVVLAREGTMNMALGSICGNNFSLQFIRGEQTVPIDNDADALFGDEPDPEVILVGTSNSAAREDESKQMNFDGYLKQFLDVDLLNYALPGAGQDGSLLEYLQSENYTPEKAPKLIIWELPANYRLEDGLAYRQLIPAIKGGCNKLKKPLLQAKHVVPGLKPEQRVEILDNMGETLQDLRGFQGMLNLRFSDKNFKNFYVLVYYDNGARDKVWYRREMVVTGGQFYLELSRSPEFRDANLMSVFIEPTQSVDEPVSIEVSLCQ